MGFILKAKTNIPDIGSRRSGALEPRASHVTNIYPLAHRRCAHWLFGSWSNGPLDTCAHVPIAGRAGGIGGLALMACPSVPDAFILRAQCHNGCISIGAFCCSVVEAALAADGTSLVTAAQTCGLWAARPAATGVVTRDSPIPSTTHFGALWMLPMSLRWRILQLML